MYNTEVRTISKERKQQVNGDIRADEVRVVDENGEMRGVMSLNDALDLATEANLDLVNVSPNARPPVCKILDFGKYRYELQKKEKQSKKNQKQMQIKEMRLSVFIDEHDINFKSKTAGKFLMAGDKVKVSIRFRGRERDYIAKGYDVMNRFAEAVSEYGTVEKKAKMEGRNMIMFLAPNSEGKKN